MKMLLTVGFMLGILAPPADLAQERPVMPGEAGHILKMTREMVQLGTTRNPDQRVDLFLRAAEERVRELHGIDPVKGSSFPRALGWSYEALVGGGALGAIESGAARGKDMTASSLHYAEATAKHEESLKRLLERIPPEERSAYDHALDLSQHGREHAQEALEHGQWLKNEAERANRAKKPEGGKEKVEEPANPERKAKPEARPEEEKKVRPENESRRPEAERPTPAPKEEPEPSRPKPAPPAHPHRPHR